MSTDKRLRSVLIIAWLGLFAGPIDAAPTQKQAQRWGEEFRDLMTERDAKAWAKRINVDELGDRALDGLGFSEPLETGFKAGFAIGITNTSETLMRDFDRNSTQLKLIRANPVSAGADILIRLDHYDKEGVSAGINYFRLKVDHHGKVLDWYDYVTVSWLSESLKQLVALSSSDSGVLSKLFGIKQVNNAIVQRMTGFGEKYREGDFKGAMVELQKFPKEFLSTRNAALLQMIMAQQIDEKSYRRYLKALAEKFGKDEDLQLVLLDHYFYQGEKEKLLSGIQGFERKIVRDAATSQLRCNALAALKRFADAERACLKGIKLEPDYEDIRYSLAELYVAQKDAENLIKVFRELERDFEIEYDLEVFFDAKEFAFAKNSPAAKAWAKSKK